MQIFTSTETKVQREPRFPEHFQASDIFYQKSLYLFAEVLNKT